MPVCYVGLQFNQIQPGVLQVCAPPNSNIAPPGYYMLWIVDDQGRPCQLARFIRVEKSSITSELELIKSYEDLLRSFEQLLAKQPCQEADLLKSLEGLLHSFETLLHDRQGKQRFLEKELLQSFECLLYSFEDLLHRFVGLGPKPLPDYCLPKNGPEGLPDLIPVAPFPPPPQGAPDTLPQNFCTEPEGGGASRVVRVIVRNQGTAAAGPSVTRVEFPNAGVAPTQPTPALGPGEEAVLDFDIPTGCYVVGGSGCSFRITVDAEDDVVESNEGNNTVLSACPGIAH